jgi:hypothetical protein
MMVATLAAIGCSRRGQEAKEGQAALVSPSPGRQPRLRPALAIRLDLSRVHFDSSDDIEAAAILRNTSDNPLVVSSRTRFSLHVEGEGALYVPNPGPVIPPWPIRRLGPGELLRHAFMKGLGDGHGWWRLANGTYEVQAVYRFRQEEADWLRSRPPADEPEIPEGNIWAGEIRSESVRIVVDHPDRWHRERQARPAR